MIEKKKIELYDKNEPKEFDDGHAISSYAKAAVDVLYQKGIVAGMGRNMFVPGYFVTRAQAAQMIYNVLKEM